MTDTVSAFGSTFNDAHRDGMWAFSFTSAPVRGAIVRLDSVWAAISRQHSAAVSQLLGEMLAATALLAHLLKDTDVALQTRGTGSVHTLMTECLGRTAMRGIARLRETDDAASAGARTPASTRAPAISQPMLAAGESLAFSLMDEVADLGRLLGTGDLAITLRPPVGEAHQGIVPLQGASVAGCIEFYFATSEQLATHIWLSANAGVAAGMLLQRVPLPPASNEMGEAQAGALWDEVTMLASTLTSTELRNAAVPTLLTNLFNAHGVHLLPMTPLVARCTCTRERSLGVLKLLGRAEVDSVLAEHGSIDMQCQFCGTDYLFLGSDVASIWDN